jgi:pantoate--beta-alanine ligase
MKKLEKIGVDVVFAPEAGEIFPSGNKTYIEVDDLFRRLCGRSRPGHFRGVATVVLKLINIVRPRVAFFGEKDFQQQLIIRKMVRDLDLEVEIEMRPTIREKDGLALSTRNANLTADQRTAALSLHRALSVAERLVVTGERNSSVIISNMREVIRSQSGVEIDYIAICHPETLSDLEAVEAKSLVAVAARVGKIRLIDNLFLDLVSLDKREKERLARKSAAKPPKASGKKGK